MHVDVINGLLGAGKTTFLLNLLEDKSKDEKIAVLVNEFGEIGLDGDLLSGQGADVVELPNGCICCTLNADLRNQIRLIAETYQPDRLYIEPTGVATIKNLMGILRSLSLEKYIDEIKIFVVIDVSMFWEIYGQNRGFVETQIEMAQVIIINKCDKVDYDEIKKIKDNIRKINKSADIMLTAFGRVLGNEIDTPKEPLPTVSFASNCGSRPQPETALKKFEQFSTTSKGTFDLRKLRQLFNQLKMNQLGNIDRAKGVFFAGGKWVRLDLASHEINEIVMDRSFGTSKIIVIGTKLQKEALKKEFRKCLMQRGNIHEQDWNCP